MKQNEEQSPWVSMNDFLPIQPELVIGYNKDWITSENKEGQRECFYNGTNWFSSAWHGSTDADWKEFADNEKQKFMTNCTSKDYYEDDGDDLFEYGITEHEDVCCFQYMEVDEGWYMDEESEPTHWMPRVESPIENY